MQAIRELREKREKARKEMEARRQLLQSRPSPRYTAPPRSPSEVTEAAVAPSPRYTAPPLRERQRYLSAKAHLAPFLTRDKTLLIEIRLYSQVPPGQLARNSALASRSIVNAIKKYDVYDLMPRLMLHTTSVCPCPS
jgi:hypothetical protein